MTVPTRLLAPKTVAVIGGREAAVVIDRNTALGFRGDIWAVNPQRSQLAGLACVPSVDDLPAAPDAAFVAVDRRTTVRVVEQLAALGCGGAVCYASGFAEVGIDGAALQAELVEAAGDMPILGPNCHGYVNALDLVALWPDVHGCRPVERGVALISQSGNVAISLSLQQRSLPVTHVVSVGNQANLGAEDVIDALLDDPRVTAIGLYLEAVRDPAAFGVAARRAAEQQVPIVALQTGRSATGAAIARSHTGALAGLAEAYDALFDRYRVVRVRTIPELLETLKLLFHLGPLSGSDLVAITCSGGEASHFADLAEPAGLRLPDFSARQAARIDRALSGRVPVSNPLDFHTYIWGDPDATRACFTAAMDGPQTATFLVLDAPSGAGDLDHGWWTTAEAFIAAREATGTPGVVVSTLPENLPPALQELLAGAGVPPMQGLAESMVAVAAAARLGDGGSALPPHHPAAHPAAPVVLDEAAAKARLSTWNIPVPNGREVDRAGIAEAAAGIGYPVAVKSLGIDHKSDAAAVVLGVRDSQELEAVVQWLPGDRLLVEEWLEGAVAELLVNVRREPPVGWVVTIGAGGTLVALHGDAVHLLAPVDPDQVVAAIRRLRVAALLDGYRSAAPGDIEQAAQVVARLAEEVVQAGDVVEVEINPLLVHPTGKGVAAVDALILLDGVDE